MKKAIIYSCVFLIALGGCATISKEKIEDVHQHSTDALVAAVEKIDAGDLAGAKVEIGKAKKAADELKGIAVKQAKTITEIKESIPYRLGQAMVGIGVTLALVGLVIVLLRYGGLGGMLASVPVLGAILARIGLQRKA